MTWLVLLYLAAIVAANLLVARFGAGITIFNALVFIALDLTTRDALHEAWHGRHLWRNMALLVGAGSILSALLNWNAAHIALASFAAFALAGVADTLVYAALGNKSRLVRMNGSNVVSAAVDSLVFPILAFGFPPLWGIVLGQFLAKTVGGALWSLLLVRARARRMAALGVPLALALALLPAAPARAWDCEKYSIYMDSNGHVWAHNLSAYDGKVQYVEVFIDGVEQDEYLTVPALPAWSIDAPTTAHRVTEVPYHLPPGHASFVRLDADIACDWEGWVVPTLPQPPREEEAPSVGMTWERWVCEHGGVCGCGER